MKLRNAVLAVCLSGLASSFANADSRSQLAVSSEGVEFIRAPKDLSAVHVLPSVIPGTVLVRQEMLFDRSPGMASICYYLVKGSADSNKELLAAMKPENLLQFSCEKAAK